ncbi:hypothetical protein KIPB_009315, partial [Kipferlia bialata]|eukprot:g9315.t1
MSEEWTDATYAADIKETQMRTLRHKEYQEWASKERI